MASSEDYPLDDRDPNILDPDDRGHAADSVPSPDASPTSAGYAHRELTVPEVAAACQISQSSVRRAIADGELRAVKLRSRVRIPLAAFDAWLSHHERPPSGTRQRPAPPRPARRQKPRTDFPPGSFREMARFDADRTA